MVGGWGRSLEMGPTLLIAIVGVVERPSLYPPKGKNTKGMKMVCLFIYVILCAH